MKQIQFFILLMVISSVVFAQSTFDGLQQKLRDKSLTEIERLELLAALSKKAFEEYPSSLDSISKAFSEAVEQNGDSIWVYKAYQINGLSQLMKGDLGAALGAHVLALNWIPSNEKPERRIKLLNNIAGIQQELGHYDKSLLFNKAALQEVHRLDLKPLLGNLFVSRAIVYFMLNQHDSAVVYADQALQLALDTKDSVLMLRAEAELQDIMLDTGNIASALEKVESRLELLRKVGRPFSLMTALDRLSEGYQLAGDLEKAKSYALEANQLAHKLGYIEHIASSYKQLATICMEAGQFEEARMALDQYGLHLTKLQGNLVNKRLSEYRLHNELAEKRLENKLLENEAVLKEKENENQRTLLFAIGMFMMLLIGFLIVTYYFQQKLKEYNRQLQASLQLIEDQKLELERKVLERTKELKDKNDRLESHSYDLSHKLRAAVARIQAAACLFIEEEDLEDKKKLVHAIDFSANEADQVIRKLINEFDSNEADRTQLN